ncbi:MAG: orotate phosphoribosyltransferase [Bryobacteraceae bacterium]
MTASSVLDLFHKTGAYLTGHFRLTSGLHSSEYLQCALVLAHPKYAERLGASLAGKLQALAPSQKISVVVAPAMGGLIIGHEVARALGVRFLFTERDASGKMVLRRGFQTDPFEHAVVVEDVITTGGSSREVIDLLRAAGTNVIAAGSVVDRSGGRADLGVKRASLATMSVISYSEDVCPMCKEGVPVRKPGSRPT